MISQDRGQAHQDPGARGAEVEGKTVQMVRT